MADFTLPTALDSHADEESTSTSEAELCDFCNEEEEAEIACSTDGCLQFACTWHAHTCAACQKQCCEACTMQADACVLCDGALASSAEDKRLCKTCADLGSEGRLELEEVHCDDCVPWLDDS